MNAATPMNSIDIHSSIYRCSQLSSCRHLIMDKPLTAKFVKSWKERKAARGKATCKIEKAAVAAAASPLPAEAGDVSTQVAAAASRRQAGEAPRTGARGGNPVKQSKWSSGVGVKPELKELYQMTGLLAKAFLQTGTAVRELQHHNGQFVALVRKESPLLREMDHAREAFYKEVKEHKQQLTAAMEVGDGENKETIATVAHSFGGDMFMEMLDYLATTMEVPDREDARKHQATLGAALDQLSSNDQMLQDLVTTCKIVRAYGERKKIVICVSVEPVENFQAALKWSLSHMGCSVREGRPPPTPLERVIQGILNGETALR